MTKFRMVSLTLFAGFACWSAVVCLTLAFLQVWSCVDKPAPAVEPEKTIVLTHDAGPALSKAEHGITLNSGANFDPKEPSVVMPAPELNGKYNRTQPTYVIGFKDCVKDAAQPVYKCCADGVTPDGSCAVGGAQAK